MINIVRTYRHVLREFRFSIVHLFTLMKYQGRIKCSTCGSRDISVNKTHINPETDMYETEIRRTVCGTKL